MGRKYMGSSFGGRKSLIRMIADRMNKKADELERQIIQRKSEQQRDHLKSVKDTMTRWENYSSIEPKDIPEEQKKFIFDILKNGDRIIVGTIRDLLYDYMQLPCRGITLYQDTVVQGYDITKIDKICLFYSKKMKSLFWLGFNSSECYILFSTMYDFTQDLNTVNLIGLDNVYSRLKSNKNYSIENVADLMSNHKTVIYKQKNNELIQTDRLF